MRTGCWGEYLFVKVGKKQDRCNLIMNRSLERPRDKWDNNS
jgi:hypothetical protein